MGDQLGVHVNVLIVKRIVCLKSTRTILNVSKRCSPIMSFTAHIGFGKCNLDIWMVNGKPKKCAHHTISGHPIPVVDGGNSDDKRLDLRLI